MLTTMMIVVTTMTIVARVIVASKAINVRAILVEELLNSDACTLHCVVRGAAIRVTGANLHAALSWWVKWSWHKGFACTSCFQSERMCICLCMATNKACVGSVRRH